MKLLSHLKNILKRNKRSANVDYTERAYFIHKKLDEVLNIKPNNIDWYLEAFSIRSPNCSQNYDRLEFLGDAVLGSIISYYLYQQYPNDNEGFLTQMKSKIVNRKNLNQIGERLELRALIKGRKGFKQSEDLSGNLLESLIGAIYMDLGYDECQKVVLTELFSQSEITRLEHKIISYKSLLLEWSQKHKIKIDYQTREEILPNQAKRFKAEIYLNGEKIINAADTSKKRAEEKAAQRAFYALNKKEKIVERQHINS